MDWIHWILALLVAGQIICILLWVRLSIKEWIVKRYHPNETDISRFQICFRACYDSGKVTEHTRMIERVGIEYDSDIIEVEEWAAKELGATYTMLMHWHKLKGINRPK